MYYKKGEYCVVLKNEKYHLQFLPRPCFESYFLLKSCLDAKGFSTPPPPLDEVQSVMQSMSRPLKAMLMTLLDLMSIAILPVDSNTVVKNVKL